MLDTFSAHSLKILEKSKDEFINTYEYKLKLYNLDKRSELGQKYHNLICAYIKGFDIDKMKLELEDEKIKIIDKFLSNLPRENFIKTEYSFLVKEILKNKPYYLTGRFDAIYKDEDYYTIYDWKTLNLPKNAEFDLQTVVYLYCASKIFNTKKLKMRYVSIEKNDFLDLKYENYDYKEKIDKIIAKYY